LLRSLPWEAYYTGSQHLENDPYRTNSKLYVELGAMGELVIGKASLFINAENLLGFRQTRYSTLLLPQRVDGHTVLRAPLTGATINGGGRFHFGAK